MKNFIHEIHRRSLWQVLGIYLAGSWIALQVVEQLTEAAGLPDWVRPFSLVLLVLGFPIVMATAFVQEGLGARHAESPTEPTSPDSSLADASEVALAPPPQPSRRHGLFTWKNALIGGGAAFGLLGVLTAGYLFMRTAGIGPAGTLIAAGVLDERDPILVGDLQSVSGDPTIARTATEALRADLAESPTITLLSPDRIKNALALMLAEPGAPLDREVSLQIAAREGVKAIITGEVNAAGSGYVITAQVLSADGGGVLVSRRESARNDDEVIEAIDALSKGIRERLGESIKSVQSSPALSQVTTASLEALRLYQEGNDAINSGIPDDRRRGHALLEEAVTIDPEFASAWRKLATDLANPGGGPNSRSRATEAAMRAYENLDRLTPNEQVRAETQYHRNVTGDIPQLIEAYERGLERFPDDVAFLNNVSVYYTQQERFERSEENLRRAWALDSTTQFHHTNLFWALALQGKLDAADSVLTDAASRPFIFVPAFGAALATARGNWDDAERIVEENPGSGAGINGIGRNIALTRGRIGEITAGEEEDLAEAERDREGLRFLNNALGLVSINAEIRDEPRRDVDRVDEALERYPLESFEAPDRPYAWLASTYARAGQADRARGFLAEWDREIRLPYGRVWDQDVHRARAEIALAAGEMEEAIAEARLAEISPCRTRCPELARVYDVAGQADSAIALYTRYVETPPLRAPPVRTPMIERLAQLLDERGDLQEAAKYYAMFVELWAEADEELQPRVRAAQARLEAILNEIG